MHIITYDNDTHREQVITLWQSVFGYEASHNEPGLVIDKKVAFDDLFFVALDDGRVTGTIMAGYDGHRGWLYSLAVHPEHRGKRLGSALLSHAQDKLIALGCNKINVQILDTNSDVRDFYEKNGFSVEARISMGKRLD